MTTFVRSYYRLSNIIYAQASDNFSLPMIYSFETVALCALPAQIQMRAYLDINSNKECGGNY
jgi:hypothetical protein